MPNIIGWDRLKPLPDRFAAWDLEMETKEHIHWRVVKSHYDNFNSVPKERRQRILERLKKGGITVGEIAHEEELDSSIVADIIYLNIKAVYLLNEESL